MRRLNCLRRRSDACNARWQRRAVLRTAEHAQQFFFLSELRAASQQEHRLAALHVHVAHAAIVLAKTERDSSERAADEHEQKDERCEALPHIHRHFSENYQ